MFPDQGRDQTDLSRLSKSAEFDPLRDIYAFLGKVGADLTYIAWLSEELKLGDTCFELLKSEMTIPGFKLSRTDPWDEICRRFPPSMLTTLESQIEPAVEARNLFSTGFRLELPPSGFELSRKLPEKLQLDLPLCFKAAISEKWSCDTLFSFLETVQEIHYGDAATGCPPDRWGTFFILAICTHLRELKGKQFQLRAIRLLKKLRGEDPGSNFDDSADAKTRIYQLKRYHPGLKHLLEETKERYYIERTEREWIKREILGRGQSLPSPWGDASWQPFDAVDASGLILDEMTPLR